MNQSTSPSTHPPIHPSRHLPTSPSPHLPIWHAVGATVGLLLIVYSWGWPWASIVEGDLLASERTVRVFQDGVWKDAVQVDQPSRRVHRLDDVPNKAWLRLDVAVREEAWLREQSAVEFVIAVSPVGGPAKPMVTLTVDPFANPADRLWQHVQVDLSPWAGQPLDIILETRAPSDHAAPHDLQALWAAPAIVAR